jgi:hypothetical protein
MKYICSIFSLSLITTLFTSCGKFDEFSKNSKEADFQLSLVNEFTNGGITQLYEESVNIAGSAEGNAVIQPKQNEVHVRLGGVQQTTVVPKLWAYMVFKNTRIPPGIEGEFVFPRDNDKLHFTMTERLPNNNLEQSSGPKSGRITITYDAGTNTYFGEIREMTFELPVNSPYRSRIMNGSFRHVPVQP